MDKIGKFIKQEKMKIIATLMVAIVFLFFWINGPILHTIEVLNLESIESKYSNPIFINKNLSNKKNKITNNTIVLEDTKEESFGLLLNKKKTKNWGLIKNDEDYPNLSLHQKKNILKHVKKLYKQQAKITIHKATKMYYATVNNKNKTFIYIESTGIVKHIKGYAGKIDVGVFVDEKGNIIQVNHIASRETKSYLANIKKAGFYNEFKNISLTKGTQEVDAISGATITSKAIAKTVSSLLEKSTPNPISNYVEINKLNTFNLSAKLDKTWILHSIILFLMFLFSFQKWKKKTKKSVTILSLLSIIYIGFFLNNSFTYITFIHPFVGTSVSSLVGLYALFVLLGAIWGKNLYCKYICPFGNIQRIIIKINPLKSSRKFFLSNKWIKRTRTSFSIILITGVLLGVRNWRNFELFPDLFGLSTITIWTLISFITILTTLIYPMLWCRLLCPTGSILDGISNSFKKNRKNRLVKKGFIYIQSK